MSQALNYKQVFQLALVGVSASLFLTPNLNAIATNDTSTVRNIATANPQFLIAQESRPIEIAQARNNGCPTNRYLLRLAETRNYTVRICATEGGALTYISRGKNGRGGITLPAMVDMGDRYEAVNGNTRYRISRNYLTVNQGSRIILRESVTRWVVGRGLQ